MMKRMVQGLLGVLFVVLAGCAGSNRLEWALAFAGDNRQELEKVLVHYKDSGQKYEAACFLIENMPYYFSYKGRELDSVKQKLAAAAVRGSLDEQTIKDWPRFSLDQQDKVFDAHVVTADYLIENIDLAFAAWKGKPWARSLSFDDFCEWILPYRIGNEPLERWRQAYIDRYQVILDSVYRGTDPVVAIDSLESVLSSDKFVYTTVFSPTRLGALFLLKHRVGYCRESTDVSAYLMRALGFPVAIDTYLYSPENKDGHQWNVLKDTTGLTVPFWYVDVRIRRGQGDGRRKGKVYRLCYGLQEARLKGMYTCDEVPPVLKSPFLKDVTAEYFGENETTVEIDSKLCGEYVYMGVFTTNGWTPIDIAEHRRGKATVRNLEPGVRYTPLGSKNGRLLPVGFPFRIEGKEAHYFRPETQVEKVKLWRKYPLSESNVQRMHNLIGAKIEISNTLDFSSVEWACTIGQTLERRCNFVSPPIPLTGRYVRFTAAADKVIELAELGVYDEEDRRMQVVWGSSNSQLAWHWVNDRDYLTYSSSDSVGGNVILDLGQKELIRKIVYVARNDDNFVNPGEEYELFYQNGSQGWVSLGRKRADKEYLYYDNIPVGALLWLRNLTKGREEQTFFLKEGKQVFGE